MRLADNLAGTLALAEGIDAAARRGGEEGRVEFARQAAAVDAELAAAEVGSTVTTVQGPIRLADYLRTRCVEAVVHGMDLQPPVPADPVALCVAVDTLRSVLPGRSATLAALDDLSGEEFLDIATGRAAPPATLAAIMPTMA